MRRVAIKARYAVCCCLRTLLYKIIKRLRVCKVTLTAMKAFTTHALCTLTRTRWAQQPRVLNILSATRTSPAPGSHPQMRDELSTAGWCRRHRATSQSGGPVGTQKALGVEYSHLFSINWCSRHDFPVFALPITRNLNRKSEKRGRRAARQGAVGGCVSREGLMSASV